MQRLRDQQSYFPKKTLYQGTVVSFVCAWVFFLSSCSSEVNSIKKQPATVQVKKVQRETIESFLNYPARVKAKIHSTILSESDGILTRVLVTLGQRVQAQQPLMILTHTDPVYQYAPVQVRAPIRGVVSAIEVNPGSHVMKGQKLASVMDPSVVEIQVEVPAADVSVFKKGMQGTFRFMSRGQPVPVQVLGISPFVDPLTGTALAQLGMVRAQNKEIHLSPGLQGQVAFPRNHHQGWMVLQAAVVYQGTLPFVRILEDGKVKQVPVVLGEKHYGSVEILEGLDDGAILIERSSRRVAAGESVTLDAGASHLASPQPSPS